MLTDFKLKTVVQVSYTGRSRNAICTLENQTHIAQSNELQQTKLNRTKVDVLQETVNSKLVWFQHY